MDLYTTAHLLGMLEERVDRPTSFALDMFFPDIVEDENEEIIWDKLPFSAPLAPFVAPNVPGQNMKTRGFKSEVFSPAYIKPKNTVSPKEARKRRAGEPINGSLSLEQRRDLYVADLLGRQEDAIDRRLEWMAWQVLRTGTCTVEGENYPSVTVNFGRKASHTKLLTGANAWDSTDFPMEDYFEDAAGEIQDATGFAGTTHIMTPSAWKIARRDKAWRETLDNRRQASGNMELSSIALANGDAASKDIGSRYVGSSGDMDFYVFDGKYTDKSGTLTSFLPGKSCISVAKQGLEGKQIFGAIEDHENLVATKLFPKMWDQHDPSKRILMTQSAPLIVPGRANAVIAATVTDN